MLNANRSTTLRVAGGDCPNGTVEICADWPVREVPRHVTRAEVLRAASWLEPRHAEVLRWFEMDPIARYGGLTAFNLVSAGRGDLVLEFLRFVRSAHRRASEVKDQNPRMADLVDRRDTVVDP